MFSDLINDVNNAVIAELSDTTAENTRTKKEFQVIFDSEYSSLDFSDSSIDSSSPSIVVHSDVDIKQGDPITVNKINYFAESLHPDGHGLKLVRLYIDGNSPAIPDEPKENFTIESW
ncbi:hypothetical protein JK628_02990 [Shewanella sp. KX20019]|uniref:head-tail joining protein n=1 Tax=Shewanella sp. KX20019 TaxID=2803864 RepID=UPI0019256478|nr:hypothetical protein [Shewanella sp. KX20019]QQX80856.1 hypothetical protein JK628_02990 [Shewanella sp. KX20019]